MSGNRPPFNRQPVKTCETCGKQCYTSKKNAKDAAKNRHAGDQMNAYECGGFWHYGHLPKGVRRGSVGRDVFPRGAA
jgi:hypothetical protein